VLEISAQLLMRSWAARTTSASSPLARPRRRIRALPQRRRSASQDSPACCRILSARSRVGSDSWESLPSTRTATSPPHSAGPAVGTAFDAYNVLMNRTQNGLSAKDLQAMRRLLPFQNLWWLRRAINAIEGETAEALHLAGSSQATVVERATRTDRLCPALSGAVWAPGQLRTDPNRLI
jgi:hypothetical protein